MSLTERHLEQQLSNQHYTRTVATALLEQLYVWGVRRVYGVIGDSIFDLLDAFAKQDAIQFIAVKQESVAAMMASAEAKCTGGLGVCIAHMGPGMANLLNGLGDAFLDGAPVLAITGQAPVKHIGTAYKQTIDQQASARAVAMHSDLVVHPDAVLEAITTAIHTAIADTTVAHVSIASDIFAFPTTVPLYESSPQTTAIVSAPQIEKARAFMREAVRPLILVGDAARHIAPDLLQLAEKWGSGIVLSYGTAGIFPYTESLVLGGLGEGGNPHVAELFLQADVVLAIDTNWHPSHQFPSTATVIQVQTHFKKLGRGMLLHCGIVGDVREIVLQLSNGLQRQSEGAAWLQSIRDCKRMWMLQNEAEGNIDTQPLHPARIVRAIEQSVTSSTIVTLDEGDATLWFLRHFRTQCAHVLLSREWRTLGFGLPAAMAAKLCYPAQHVICVTGDGGLAMVLADMLTASMYELPITLVVFNNGALQMEHNKMQLRGLIPNATTIANPNFVLVAQACGWEAHRIRTETELEQQLKAALTSRRPVLLDVLTAQAVYPDYQLS